MYDVIVIGAGISGLSAAWHLKDKKVLVLEKEPEAGGRIRTRTQQGIAYDVGAVFGVSGDQLPFQIEDEWVAETDPLAFWWKGAVHTGGGVISCLAAAAPEIRLEARRGLLRLWQGESLEYEHMTEACQKVLNAFFQVIHPGDMVRYVAQRYKDAFSKFDVSHFANGNQVIAKGYLQELKDGSCRIGLETTVTAIDEKDGIVEVRGMCRGTPVVFFGKSAIVTVPAPIAVKMLKKVGEASRKVLEGLEYGGGIVVVFALKNVKMLEFAYMVTPELSVNTILRQHTTEADTVVLTLYYTGDKAKALESATNEIVMDDARQVLAAIGIQPEKKQVLFEDICRWDCVGPIISPEVYADWDPAAVCPSRRVFLAGEYTYINKNDPFPYGMAPAAASGICRAREVRCLLAEAKEKEFVPECLIRVTTYQLTGQKPIFRKQAEEGDVAFYGLLLQGTPDKAVQKYLLDATVNGLWEYQKGFGVTAEDSCLVLEGLMAAEVDKEMWEKSLEQLVEKFYMENEGAFCTLQRGRAAYWAGPSVDATGMAAYFLDKANRQKYKDIIEKCRNYLVKTQERQGCWRSRWFPSRLIPTWYSVRLLASSGRAYGASLEKAVAYVLKEQQPDGSWNSSLVDTAAAVLVLKQCIALAGLGLWKEDLLAGPLERGMHWLVEEKGFWGKGGEALLYYWFEEMSEIPELIPPLRVFYHASDKGRISAAWVQTALAAVPDAFDLSGEG